MGVELHEAFPDAGGAVCSTFFSSVDLSDKLWASVERLAHADDITFWTVVANHPKLAVVLINVVTAVDHAHSSHSKAQRRAVNAENERHVIEIIVRLASSTEPCARRGVDPASLATRLGVLLPWKLLMPAALMLLRHSGAAASVTVTALVVLNPGYLCTLNTFMPTWFDSVNRFAVRCAHELQRGRYQRLPGDILTVFEQVYRLTKQLWAVMQCAPFLSDYLPLPRTLRALRIIVDVLSPILQHFIIVCDELSNRRAILSRANSVIVNAAINTTSVLLLYHTYTTQGPQKHHNESCCVPEVVKTTYSRLREHLQQYALGYPQYILQASRGQSLVGLLHHLCPPARAGDASGEHALGQVLLSLAAETTDSSDFAEAARGSRQRFFELVLLDVVRQGVHIDGLLARHLVTAEEAAKLGASEDAISRALAGLPPTDAASASASPAPAPSSSSSPSPAPAAAAAAAAVPQELLDDPLVSMVMDVFPQYSPVGIRAALNFYANDVEQFIMDASMENLPPHLVGPLTAAAGQSDAELAAALAAEDARAVGAATPEAAYAAEARGASQGGAHLHSNDFDDAFAPETLYRLLGRDLYELVTDSDGDDGVTEADMGDDNDEDVAFKTTLDDPRTYMSDAFDVDEEMKAKIRLLNEIMYEDELDDGQQDVHLAGGDIIDDDDDEAGGRKGRNRKGGLNVAGKQSPPAPAAHADAAAGQSAPGAATGGPPQRAPRDDYHDKRYHEKRSKDRETRTKEMQAERSERVPSYASKKKTSKAKVSGTKASLQRAVKKGKYDFDS